jgi:acyl-CoA synthetase (AMP-forming)/AMP-acid ligase II
VPADSAPSNQSDMPLRTLIEQQSAHLADAPFLTAAYSERSISYVALTEQVAWWRDVASSWRLTDGDRVGLLISDPLDFSLCFIALLAAGVWIAPLDPTITYASGSQLNGRIASLRLNCVLGDRPAPYETSTEWQQLSSVTTLSDGEEQASPVQRDRAEGGVILASSGTTGTPKIMALPTSQLLHTAKLIATHNGLDRSDRGLNPLPLWHINAEVVGLLATLVSGGSLVLDERFHRTGFWSLVERTNVTWINAVPAIISRLSLLREGESVPARVRFVRSASAPLSPALLAQFEDVIGVPVIESYGMTEAASQISANPLGGPRKSGSVGRAVGVDVRVAAMDISPSGRLAMTNEVGRVEIRGPSVIRRYEGAGYEDRFDGDGWLDTGDLGYFDDDRFLFLVGRSDDVINRGGEKIFPREIEDVILGVQGVVGAAVLGIADDVFGQVPTSYVQLDGVSASTPVEELRIATKEIHVALVAAFSKTRRPVTINVVAQLPAHATGKIQKKVLADGSVRVLFQEYVS